MQTLAKVFLSAAAGAGLLAATAVSASAGIACVGPVCWHTHEAYEYPPDARVTVHPDDWRWGKMKNTHGANTRGAAIGAATNGWNGSRYDDQRRATILPRVVDST